MKGDRLYVADLREVEKDTHIIVDLHDDCYWEQAEGYVDYVTEYDDGSTTVGMHGLRGHQCRLKIPSDGRQRMTFTGQARGARNLPVDAVYERL